jgi:transcriptional regulator with XRE-family HTH domain
VDKTIGERIRRIRAGKGYSQANVAEDLGITTGAYSKIERGDTDANVSRLLHIAQVLEVHICEFFDDDYSNRAMEAKKEYGYATKEEVENLSKNIQALLQEFTKLKAELNGKEKPAKKKK